MQLHIPVVTRLMYDSIRYDQATYHLTMFTIGMHLMQGFGKGSVHGSGHLASALLGWQYGR